MEKEKKRTKNIKEIHLPMKFNPGTQKYEPVLPVRKGSPKIGVDWLGLIFIILSVALLVYFLIKNLT